MKSMMLDLSGPRVFGQEKHPKNMIGNSTVPIFQHFFLEGFRSCPRNFFKSIFFGTCLASQSTVPSVLYSIFGAVCCNSFGGNASKHHLKNQLVHINV